MHFSSVSHTEVLGRVKIFENIMQVISLVPWVFVCCSLAAGLHA